MSQVTTTSRTFLEMGIVEKLAFCGKLCIFFVSLGFAFPRLLSN